MMWHKGTTEISQRRRIILLLLGIVVIVAIDQASKAYAIRHWMGQPRQSFLQDVFRIEFALNKGAFLGFMKDWSEKLRFLVLTIANGVVLAALTVYLATARRMAWNTYTPLLLIVGGGIGNLIDRIRFGSVVDFFNLGIGDLRTGIFNAADMAITLGFFLMIPLVIWGEAPNRNPSEDKDLTVKAAG